MNPALTLWLELIGLVAAEVVVIIGIAAQLQRITRSAVWRRTIWQACILSLLLLLALEFTGVARGLAGWIRRKPVAVIAIPSRVENAKSTTPAVLVDPPTQDHVVSHRAFVQPAPRNLQPAKTSAPPVVNESLAGLWLVLAWLVGTAVVIGRALVSRTVLEVFRWRRKEIEKVELFEAVQALSLRLGIRRQVRLMESARIPAPVAFGILRPTIGLPSQFGVKFNSAQQEAMLAHELAHLAGNDPAWYLLADVLAAILWWHPLTWWARRQLHAQSELVADEASLLVANGPDVLAECLVELGVQLAQTRSFVPLGVAGPGYRSGLGQRVERLVKLEGRAWRPPNQIRCGLVRTLGPVALVAASILCSAWVIPPALTKGENMQTIKQTWKNSLAAFALLTAFGSNNNPAIADTTATPAITKSDARSAPTPAGYGQSGEVPPPPGYGQSGENPKSSGGASGGSSSGQSKTSNFSTRLMRLDSGEFVRRDSASGNKERAALEAKLKKIILPSIKYDGLPLTEVINNLIEQSMSRDPEKQGVNFVLDRETPASAPPAIDPNTGLPLPSPATVVDLSSVTVKIDPAIKNVRLIDVLDVITKTADTPINYSIQDYGVVFSFGAPKPSAAVKPILEMLEPPLEVMTFKLDTNTFMAGMHSMFGTPHENDPKAIKSVIGEIFKRLGIAVNPPQFFGGSGGSGSGADTNAQNRSYFYNELNGVLVVRATRQDLEAVNGVLEALGATVIGRPSGASVGGFFGGSRASSGGGGTLVSAELEKAEKELEKVAKEREGVLKQLK